MKTITLQEAQANLPNIIHQLPNGDEVLITEGNQVVARIVGDKPVPTLRPGPGLCKELITILADDDEHLQDFVEYIP